MSAVPSSLESRFEPMEDDIPCVDSGSNGSGDGYSDVPAFLHRQIDDSIDESNESTSSKSHTPLDNDEQQTPIKSLEVAELLRALRKSGFRAS